MIAGARRAFGVDGAIVAVLSLGLGFFPLFAGPGYESALGTGLVVPAVAAASVAWSTSHPLLRATDRVRRGLSRGAWLAVVAYACTLLHGLRAGFCDARGGSLLFLLGPMSGILLGGAWGSVAGQVASRGKSPARRVLVALSLGMAGPFASGLVSLVRFYASPMVFAFDPFAGFFSGMLYDTVVDGASRLATYRAGTVGSIVALIFFAMMWDDARLRRGPVALAFALASSLSLGVTFSATALGHAQTPHSIALALGKRSDGKHCTVIHAKTTKKEEVALFVRDCDERVAEVSTTLGVSPPHITAYLFPDAEEKRRLMGAAEVYVAKPWRREVYVQPAGYPHPILGHEIAHAIAGSFGRGPFAVAGRVFGLLPDPGLIEGLAVAASPDEDEDLSPETWSRAMLEIGLLPPMKSLFSLGFLGHDAGKAYTVAGAFVRYVARVHGWSAVRRWYAGEELAAVTGKTLDAHEADFHAYLRTLTLDESVKQIARSRFDRPAIFERTCPHELDRQKRDAALSLSAGDLDGAVEGLEVVLAKTPRDATARLVRATCSERRGELPDAMVRLTALAADQAASRIARDRATERLGDLALVAGELDAAAAHYKTVTSRTVDEDRKRTLDVKMRAVTDPRARDAIVSLLIGTPKTGPDQTLGAVALGKWIAEGDDDGLAHYLLARTLVGRGDYAGAVARLDVALERLSAERVRREALRMSAVARCALGDRDGAQVFAAKFRASSTGERAVRLDALVARCAR